MRHAAAAIGLALGSALASWGATGSVQVMDQGSFDLYLDGARVGQERFTIREERLGAGRRAIRSGAELNLKLESQTIRVRVALESVGPSLVPRRYEAEVDGPERIRILGVLSRDRLRISVRSDRGEEIRQSLVKGLALILDKHIAHHYFFAVRLLDGRESLQANAIVPRDRRERRVTIRDHGMQSTDLDGREVSLRHVTVTPEGEQPHHVWLDADRIVKVEIPSDGWVAVRVDGSSGS